MALFSSISPRANDRLRWPRMAKLKGSRWRGTGLDLQILESSPGPNSGDLVRVRAYAP